MLARELRTSEVLSALSYALDLTEGQPPGHAVRSCLARSSTAAAGLSGDELSLTARIRAVADILEAMTAARPYREPIPVDEVLSELDRDAGTKLDAGCIDALRKWAASSR